MKPEDVLDADGRMPCIGEVMTAAPLSVPIDATVRSAEDAMIDHDVRHLPVTEGGALVGIVSARDLRRCEVAGKAEQTPVGEIMADEPITVGPRDPAPDAATLMATAKVSALPVLQDGKLVGLLTLTDLLDHCMATLREPDGSA